VAEPNFVRLLRIVEAKKALCIFTYLRKLKRRLQFSITVLGLLDSPCTIMLLTPWGFPSLTQSNYRVGSLDPVLEFGLVTKVESTTPSTVGPVQINLLPCPFLHHYPDVHLSVFCVVLLYRAFLDELFPMLSVMFSRMLYHTSPTNWDAHSFFVNLL